MKLVDELGNEVVVPVKYRKKVKQMMTANDQEGVSLLVAQFGGANKTGYTPGTDTYDNPYNVIPGGDITMQNTPFPVMGYPLDGNHNVGEPMLMKPGGEYNFPGASQVLEVPAHQFGKPPRQHYEIPNTELNPFVSLPQEEEVIARPQPIAGLEPQPPSNYGAFSRPPTPIDPNIDQLLSQYTQYLDKADSFNEQNYPQSQQEYSDLIHDLRGYSAAQGASSTLGTLMQNPYTQAPLLDQGFADAARKSRRMPQYLLDTQRAEAESQMSRVANQLISSGARPAEIASMMAPYYQDLQRTQNQLALQRFQANSEADRDYYSFLTELKGKNTIADVENKNRIVSAQNQQIQQLADTTTDQFRNLAELRSKDVELQRGAAKEYNDNLFRTALARLGIAGPELEYRMRERELSQTDRYMQEALKLFKGNPDAVAATVNIGGNSSTGKGPGMSISTGKGGDWYQIPDSPTAWRSYPEDRPAGFGEPPLMTDPSLLPPQDEVIQAPQTPQTSQTPGGTGPLPPPPPAVEQNPFETWPVQAEQDPNFNWNQVQSNIQMAPKQPSMNDYRKVGEWFKKNTSHLSDKQIIEEAGKTYYRKNKQKSPIGGAYRDQVDKDIERGDLVFDEAQDRYVRIKVRDKNGKVIWDASNPNHPSIEDIKQWGQTSAENRRTSASAKAKRK